MHMVVYTCWCWHIYKGGGVPRVERSVGFSSQRENVFENAFEKIECIFFVAPVGNLEKSRECILLRNTHQTLAFSVRCAVGCSRVHRTHRSESGAQRPVCGQFGDPLCA